MKHITITGSLGSGKSVVSALLKKALGYSVVSVGGILREMAHEHGMDATAFNQYMEQHPELDHLLDRKQTALGQDSEPKIFDSRLAWHFVPNAFKVCLNVSDAIAAQRIYQDKERVGESYQDSVQAGRSIKQRRESELLRYRTLYGVELENPEQYDLVISTDHLTPIEVANQILQAYLAQESLESPLWLCQVYKVADSHSAQQVGSGDMPVLSTPSLIAFMENCAMLLGKRVIPEAGDSSVGTQLSTNHLHASPVGAEIVVRAQLTQQEGRRLLFDITADDSVGRVAQCQHERFVVSRQRFLERIGL